jgi:hypothetical protein
MKWNQLPVPTDDAELYRDAVRLNSLGSLFFFAHYVLKKKRLAALHWHMCETLETEDLHLAFEIPMSHFKTSIGVEALAIWWALSFTNRDEELMRGLGYDDEWVAWMRAAHDQNARTLITHETDTRVVEMGKAIDGHYLHNDIFRYAFSDLIPTSGTTWNNHSKFQRRDRSASGDMTTATYAMRSVGQALQGIHATGIINDDSVGKAAQDNMLRGDGGIMEDTYRWWTQTTTRFDPSAFTLSGIGRQLVIGNRWGHEDLNSKIRANHPEFKFETHDAEGGCCELHPIHGIPIFPEEWTMARLHKMRETLTLKGNSYDYIHFFRNKTTNPEDSLFKPEWIRNYICIEAMPGLDREDIRNFLILRHKAYGGVTLPDMNAGVLYKRMIVSLADKKKKRRKKHVVLVAGYDSESDRIYLLRLEVGTFMHGDLLDLIYKLAATMGLDRFYLAKDAAESMKFYLDERNRRDPKKALTVIEMECDDSENGQANRIGSLQTLFKSRQFWTHVAMKEFASEYEAYPAGALDVLDTIGLIPQTLDSIKRRDALEFVQAQNSRFLNRKAGSAGY